MDELQFEEIVEIDEELYGITSSIVQACRVFFDDTEVERGRQVTT